MNMILKDYTGIMGNTNCKKHVFKPTPVEGYAGHKGG